jgi:transposase
MAPREMSTTPGRKARRQFTPEYKAQVVQVCRVSGKSPEAVARDLGLTPTAVRRWYDQARIDAGGGGKGPLTTEERAELAELRKKVRVLEQEREILKKATSFFARECTS